MSVLGEIVVCNVMASSKLWYYGAVSLVSKPNVDLFQRKTFRFNWQSEGKSNFNVKFCTKPFWKWGPDVTSEKNCNFSIWLIFNLFNLAHETLFFFYWIGLLS